MDMISESATLRFDSEVGKQSLYSFATSDVSIDPISQMTVRSSLGSGIGATSNPTVLNVVAHSTSATATTIEHLRKLNLPAQAHREFEYEAALAKQGRLAHRVFLGNATRNEKLQLNLIRWQIDRHEAERYANDIDRLRDLVERQKEAASQIEQLAEIGRMHLANSRGR